MSAREGVNSGKVWRFCGGGINTIKDISGGVELLTPDPDVVWNSPKEAVSVRTLKYYL